VRKALRSSLLVVLLVGAAVAAAGLAGYAHGAASGQAAPQAAQIAQGQVWTYAPAMPWDKLAVKDEQWSKLLDQQFDLTRRGQAGEKRTYLIRRENLMHDRLGRPVNRMVAEARIVRTLLSAEQPGYWTERIEWQRFAAGQSQGPGDSPVLQESEQARGLSYEFSPHKFDYVNIPGDFGRIGNEMTGYLMKVVGMDFSGFDALLLAVRDTLGKPEIGDAHQERRWEQATEIGRPSGAGTAGRYQLGEMRISVAGITRRNGEPGLLIWFSAEGNEVKQDMGNDQFRMRLHGTEYFRGEMAVSLLDGHILGGELFGPLPWVMEMGMGGQALKEMPIAGVMQQLSLWEVSSDSEQRPSH